MIVSLRRLMFVNTGYVQQAEASKEREAVLEDAALEYGTENGNGNGQVAAGKGKGRATVVVGESFGGLLALAVALTLGKDAQTYIKYVHRIVM
jgi:pimeloyl-ACP methyl ester carboxylesterase